MAGFPCFMVSEVGFELVLKGVSVLSPGIGFQRPSGVLRCCPGAGRGHSVRCKGFNQRFLPFGNLFGGGMELEWFLRMYLLRWAFGFIVQFCSQSFER